MWYEHKIMYILAGAEFWVEFCWGEQSVGPPNWTFRTPNCWLTPKQQKSHLQNVFNNDYIVQISNWSPVLKNGLFTFTRSELHNCLLGDRSPCCPLGNVICFQYKILWLKQPFILSLHLSSCIQSPREALTFREQRKLLKINTNSWFIDH